MLGAIRLLGSAAPDSRVSMTDAAPTAVEDDRPSVGEGNDVSVGEILSSRSRSGRAAAGRVVAEDVFGTDIPWGTSMKV
jgi:hypothetical protein